MSNFALSTSDNYGDVIAGLNYALSNLGTFNADTAANVLVANTTTGEITTTSVNAGGYSSTTIVSYLYQYMDVKYSNSATGGSGFSSNSANKSYYGLYNTANTSISSNPADFQWYQVTGGFGTTKGLYYQTIGGRQVQFFPSNVAPTNSFIAVPDNTALNLDTITSAQNNQIVNVNAYYQANAQPATPSGGTYNFTTFTLTAPAGWSANIPSSANTSVYVSTAAFSGNSNATSVPPATSWTVPAVYTSQFQGNTGPAGQRGFVPMGFVITASDPTTYSNAQFTTAYSSSRTNSSPPIGLGFSPIQYDTSQFAYQNLFTGNTITVVKQYDGAGWTSVVGNVISGGLFVPGSINANTLNVNQVYALTISSTNATVGDFNSNGFWMQSSTGDARLAGNTSIGNNLIVGQNAQIGANLNVGINANIGSSLIVGQDAQIGSNLNVGSSAIIGTNLTIGANASVGANLVVGQNAIIGTNLTIGANASVGANLVVGQNAVIGANLTVTGLITQGNLQSNTVPTTAIQVGAVTATTTVSSKSGSLLVGITQNSATRSFWPNNTRGVVLNGNVVGATNANITVSYNLNVYNDSNSNYNLVELWKQTTGNVTSYDRILKSIVPGNGSGGSFAPVGTEFWIAGAYGSRYAIWANSVQNVNPVTDYSQAYNVSLDFNVITETGYTNTQTVTPPMTIFGYQLGGSGNTVGSGGTILTGGITGTGTAQTNFTGNGSIASLGDLYSIASNPITPFQQMVVGQSGIILGNSGAGWSPLNFGNVTTNWNAVSTYQRDNTGLNYNFIMVGDNGRVAIAVPGSAPTLVNVGTTTNLRGVCYDSGLNHILICGDNGTIIYSTDRGATWGSMTPTYTNNLRSIAYNSNRGFWFAVGDGIILKGSGLTYSLIGFGSQYVGNTFVSTNMQRLTYNGSFPYIGQTTPAPPTQQQINNQFISGTYIDQSPATGTQAIYYLVAGNLNGGNTYVTNPTMTITLSKR